MPTFIVTIVDLLGVFVPGFAMLISLILIPTQLGVRVRFEEFLSEPLGSNIWVVGGACAIAAYILGFLVRLVSIRIMNLLTRSSWGDRLREESDILDKPLTLAFGNKQLTDSLKRLAEGTGEYNPGHYAPYFHYAKRIVRREPTMWAEAERLEAEVRFTAGLFIPLVLLTIDGVVLGYLAKPFGWGLAAVASVGVITILRAFPTRRSREVLYNHFLALAILTKSKELSPEKAPPKAAV